MTSCGVFPTSYDVMWDFPKWGLPSLNCHKGYYYDQCFMWSVTRALNSKEIPTLEELRQLAKKRGLKRYSELNKDKLLKQLKVEVDQNLQRIDKKLQEQAEKLNWNGINFPASWKDIDKFEIITRLFP